LDSRLKIVEDDEAAGEYVRQRMLCYTRTKIPLNRDRLVEPVRLTLRDADNMIMGGLLAYINTCWRRCSIDILWIEEEFRNLGYGRALLEAIEELAKKRDCQLVTVNTASFLAPDFYRKCGYELCGTTDSYPVKGHKLYAFKKTLQVSS
jgi:ribosomal protein S18 acetylase RimI-like enzyme